VDRLDPLESGRTSIDLVTTHTVTVDGNVVPISVPYTRVVIEQAIGKTVNTSKPFQHEPMSAVKT
jgi:hypothetical protein